MMKKLLTFLSIFVTLFSCFFWYGFTTADTENPTQIEWVRITNKDTWLYKNATNNDSDKLFILQYSYYAKVKETTQNGFYYVEVLDNFGDFVKVFGYVLAQQVEVQTQTPLSPTYPTLFATVSTTNPILFCLPDTTSQSVCVVYQGQVLSYFGTYPTRDKTWYLVRMDQTLCYVNADNVNLPAVNLHPTPIVVQTEQPSQKEPTTPDPPLTDTQNTTQLSKLQVTLVAIIALSAVVIVVILFLPVKSKKQKDFFYDVKDDDKNSIVLTEETSLRPRYFDDYL